MKREIYCMKCKERVQAAIKPEELPPGERVKYVDGKALKRVMCDFCGLDIQKDWVVCCFSNYIEGVRPYVAWETEFVEVLPAAGAAADPVPIQGVYGLLATGTEDALIKFHLALSMILNFLERRDHTVHCMCMGESLGLAIGTAKKFDVTLQRIENKDDDEVYPILHQGTHGRWEKGGYVK